MMTFPIGSYVAEYVADQLYKEGAYGDLISLGCCCRSLHRKLSDLREDLVHKLSTREINYERVYVPLAPGFGDFISYNGKIFHRGVIKLLAKHRDIKVLTARVNPNYILYYGAYFGDMRLLNLAIRLGALNMAWAAYGAAHGAQYFLCNHMLTACAAHYEESRFVFMREKVLCYCVLSGHDSMIRFMEKNIGDCLLELGRKTLGHTLQYLVVLASLACSRGNIRMVHSCLEHINKYVAEKIRYSPEEVAGYNRVYNVLLSQDFIKDCGELLGYAAFSGNYSLYKFLAGPMGVRFVYRNVIFESMTGRNDCFIRLAMETEKVTNNTFDDFYAGIEGMRLRFKAPTDASVASITQGYMLANHIDLIMILDENNKRRLWQQLAYGSIIYGNPRLYKEIEEFTENWNEDQWGHFFLNMAEENTVDLLPIVFASIEGRVGFLPGLYEIRDGKVSITCESIFDNDEYIAEIKKFTGCEEYVISPVFRLHHFWVDAFVYEGL